MFLVLLCCQYGVSYRIYILPEPGAFCIGVFSGDDCITWSKYSARPTFVDHSTTLIFTPGNYSLCSTFSIANIKSFTVIGDEATLLFHFSLRNIGYVHLHGLILNNPSITVHYVHSFVLENCTLSRPPGSSSVGLRLYGSNQNKIIDSTFERVQIYDSQSRMALSVKGCLFTNTTGSWMRVLKWPS